MSSTAETGLLADVRSVIATQVEPAVRSHLGDIEVTDVDADGVVGIAFSGACTNCSYRKQTLLGAVYPAVMNIEGVTGLRSHGVPISHHDLSRVRRWFPPATNRE